MSIDTRTYSRYADQVAKKALNALLDAASAPEAYRGAMVVLGRQLGDVLEREVSEESTCLVASTAEDADFLAHGVLETLQIKHKNTLTAVFWNNHYSIPGGSVAPIVHKFLQPGYEKADSLIIVKSVISGSCVVRTNILALIEKLINIKHIYIVSPVMHSKSEQNLQEEFPEHISSLFKFIYFAKDSTKDADGEVKPGIGGQIYHLLGLSEQPAKSSFVPEVVKRLAGIM
ncbi:hypothetical protein [Iodobacter fluviatilis]|uniref:Uncharacterized protein n=1 Tax=Iodobacter fluviatilis TaxID=537 RepID=A0A7G3GAS1_9NEIS|nr:hypothetical protein [Iodobacter fluviatilis]QBC43835.1 hypothetical protein C1H71_09930 [Iodobacter fluviatilis]